MIRVVATAVALLACQARLKEWDLGGGVVVAQQANGGVAIIGDDGQAVLGVDQLTRLAAVLPEILDALDPPCDPPYPNATRPLP